MFTDIALISSTLLGPVLAVQVQKYLERWREESERRKRIFKTLMATRAARLAPAHIEALNLIDIEFPATHKPFKKVRSAWKAYLSHLREPLPDDQQVKPVYFAKREELFTDLLYEMGTALGYDFDKTQISKDAYSTVFHENLEADLQTIRTKIIEILTGKTALPMAVVEFPSDPDVVVNQADYLKIMAEHLRQGKPWPITVVGNDTNSGKIVPMRPADLSNEGKTG
jgi:hypothetical protein